MISRIIRAYEAEFGPGTAWRDLSRCAFGFVGLIVIGCIAATAFGGY